jgi:hypothetical protein
MPSDEFFRDLERRRTRSLVAPDLALTVGSLHADGDEHRDGVWQVTWSQATRIPPRALA